MRKLAADIQISPSDAGALRWARMSSQWPSPPHKPSDANRIYSLRSCVHCHSANANGAMTRKPASGVLVWVTRAGSNAVR